MKLIDKLKNALFEEEYVEVEEKPKKKKFKEEKPKKKKEEKPIAKKIVQPKEEKEDEIEVGEEEHLGEALAFDVEEEQKQEENGFKFPMVSDSEFDNNDDNDKDLENPEFLFDENDYHESKQYQPKVEKPKKEQIPRELPKVERPVKIEDHKPYGIDEFSLDTHDYDGLYEKKEDRTYFKPSPIISPIYGILDKDYKKDDITAPRREVRLTSSYAREKIDVDDVRRKAFGEIKREEIEDDYGLENEEEKVVDLSSDAKTPEVNKVTVGDAEEYFEDLGLEYNVDYKDKTKEEATGRRSTKKRQEQKEDEVKEEEKKESKKEEEKDKKTKDDVKTPESKKDDDNLFDLIDSMYDNE